jgi:hypothetical protein
LPAVVPGKLQHFKRKSAFGQVPEKGAAGRCYFRSLLQGFQESSFGVLPVFFGGRLI